MVRLFVAGKPKLSERLDMMNVKFNAQINLGNTAALASVAVALAGLVALWAPAWAIILLMTALPIDVLWTWQSRNNAASTLAVPACRALLTAEHTLPPVCSRQLRRNYLKCLAALFAYALDTLAAFWLLMFGKPTSPAFARTDMHFLVFAVKIAQLATHIFAALVASEGYSPALHKRSASTRFRAIVCRAAPSAREFFSAGWAGLRQPCRRTPARFRAIHLRLVGVCRWVIPKFLPALRAYRACFLHCTAFRRTTVSSVIIAQPC